MSRALKPTLNIPHEHLKMCGCGPRLQLPPGSDLLPPLNGDTWLFLLSVALKAPAEGARAACALPKAEGCHIEWNSWLERGVPLVWDRQMGGVEKEEGGWHRVGR